MPELIRVNHDLFVKRFMQDGLTRNVGKVRNQYIRDFKGYIKPV
jgi:Asp-tRNA(Asn)/Glu-tRNA(Gln) amidotransferase C subunit